MKIVNFSILCIFLMIPFSTKSVCNIDQYDYSNFQPQIFLLTCNWFKLKAHYYDLKNADEPNDVAVQQVKDALVVLGAHRKAIIKATIRMHFGNKCKWVENFTGGYETRWNTVKDFFSGQLFYLECDVGGYVLNSFGSETVTSDFDFSVYSFSLMQQSSFETEIQSIMDVTALLAKVGKIISLVDCGGQSMADCLDSNGYPEIMVLYFTKMNGSLLLGDNVTDDARYLNVFSSKILRYCVVSPIYYSRISKFQKHKDSINNDIATMMEDCYKSHITAMLNYRKAVKLTDEHNEEEVWITPYPREEVNKNKMIYLDGLQDEEIAKMINLAKFFQGDQDFTDCIMQINKPRYFLMKMYGQNQYLTERVLMRDSIRYDVQAQIFYIPNTYSSEKSPIPNRILLPFIGACHIWASEAYVTFGALEFVRTEKKLLNKDVPFYANCGTLLETFIENFGMMLYHLAEIEHENEQINYEVEPTVIEMQEVSDAFSKYLRRAIIALNLNCKNDYGEPISTFYNKNEVLTEEIIDDKFYQAFLRIDAIDTGLATKKDEYFKIFKEMFGGLTLSQLIDQTMTFFKSLHHKIFTNINEKDLFINANEIDRRLILV